MSDIVEQLTRERDALKLTVRQLEEFIGRREDDILSIARERDALKAENQMLREALVPFVEWVDEIDTSQGDYNWRDDQSILRGLKMGSFRHARIILHYKD